MTLLIITDLVYLFEVSGSNLQYACNDTFVDASTGKLYASGMIWDT